MTKFNLNIDKPAPTDEQIAKHQDFDRLLKQYYAAAKTTVWQRLRKSPTFWVGLIVAVAAAGLVLQGIGGSHTPAKIADEASATPTSASAAGELTLFPSGTQVLALPVANTAAAQRTRQGVSIVVPAKMELRYRELHRSQLLSMLEVFAVQNGNRVTPSKPTPMEISYMGGTAQPRTISRYDEASATWQKIGTERVSEISAMAALPPKPTLESVRARFLADNPQPEVAAPTQPFALELDLTALPELDAYDRVCWDYVGSSHPNRRAWDETWDNVSIARAGGDLYTLTFARRGESVAVTARALKGSAACRNAQDADMMHKSVDKKLSDAQAIKAAYDMELAQWEALYEAATRQPKAFKRTFTAPSVGIYKAE